MWILKFLPDWVFYFILLAGLAGIAASFVLKFIPFVSQYRIPILWASAIATAGGLYMAGAISDNNAWEARVADLKLQVAKAEAASQAANTELTAKMAEKNKEIAAKQAELNKRVAQSATAMDKSCTVTSDVISILNDAAGAKK